MENELNQNGIAPANEQGGAIELANGRITAPQKERMTLAKSFEIIDKNFEEGSDGTIQLWNAGSKAENTESQKPGATLHYIPLWVYKTEATAFDKSREDAKEGVTYNWVLLTIEFMDSSKKSYKIVYRKNVHKAYHDSIAPHLMDRDKDFANNLANLEICNEEELKNNNYKPTKNKVLVINSNIIPFGGFTSIFSEVKTKNRGRICYDYKTSGFRASLLSKMEMFG